MLIPNHRGYLITLFTKMFNPTVPRKLGGRINAILTDIKLSKTYRYEFNGQKIRDSDNVRKIAVLTPYFPTMGGGEKEMAHFCQFMESFFPRAKIDLLVFNYNDYDVFGDGYPGVEDLETRFGVRLNKTHLLKIKLSGGTNINSLDIATKSLVENITQGYDIFLNFMFMSKHRGKAKINIYRCMFPPKRKTYRVRGLSNTLMNESDKNFVKSYNVFLPNSFFTESWMIKYWPKLKEKSLIIYPPVFSLESIQGRYDEGEKRNFILSVGRFQAIGHNKKQDKMVDFFINNFDSLNGYEYHIVGGVPLDRATQKYLESIKSRIKGYPIYLHLNCPYNELTILYHCSKIFWHATGFGEDDQRYPQKMEHFGITTVEAMSYGVVPVVIHKGGQPEIVKDGQNGFLWNTEAECIFFTKKLISDCDLRVKLAKNAYKRAVDFSIEQFNVKNSQLFKSLLLKNHSQEKIFALSNSF